MLQPKNNRRRIVLWAAVTLLGASTCLFRVEYAVPATGFGPIGDGSQSGYEMVRAFGLFAGSVVYETRHRTATIGWRCGFSPEWPRVLPSVEGFWPTRSYSFPAIGTLAILIIALNIRSNGSVT